MVEAGDDAPWPIGALCCDPGDGHGRMCILVSQGVAEPSLRKLPNRPDLHRLKIRQPMLQDASDKQPIQDSPASLLLQILLHNMLFGHNFASEYLDMEGYTVPAKPHVVINAWAIGRDPKYWEAAEEFQPERFKDGVVDFTGSSYEFLPFGAGRRMCPGFNYGLASMELALVGLLYHFDWSLPEGVADVDMDEAPALHINVTPPAMKNIKLHYG
ncbi:Premnaspirodiene oxygenase [Hordeum vulgare]|nr:Premnaspirodiene oxygenase [Hordeum vulgare]